MQMKVCTRNLTKEFITKVNSLFKPKKRVADVLSANGLWASSSRRNSADRQPWVCVHAFQSENRGTDIAVVSNDRAG